MMSYVLQTVNGKVIVIDGGTAGDAPYLRDFLKAHRNRVDAWFLTHMHDDHIDALREILKKADGLEIGPMYASMPDLDWINQFASPSEKKTCDDFAAALTQANRHVEELTLGQKICLDGVCVEVLGIRNPEIHQNPWNNSSVVLRVSDRRKSILFLADLGVEGGRKLLEGPYADRLPSDYVQMAHHGQRGVSSDFYRRVNPTYCLWPTPKWLWDNDLGKGVNSGQWKTLEVRSWMEQFPIKKHFLMFEGLQTIQ